MAFRREGSPAARAEGQGARAARGGPVGVLEGVKQWLEGARRRGTGSGGEGDRRRRCSGGERRRDVAG